MVNTTPLILETQSNKTCEFEGCDKPAVVVVCEDKDPRDPRAYCFAHGAKVVHTFAGEYGVSCPNCGCWFVV